MLKCRPTGNVHKIRENYKFCPLSIYLFSGGVLFNECSQVLPFIGNVVARFVL
ncbi:hypothetical protein Hanom_Chr04g00304121 [Helianthus anomalus]